MKETFLNWIHFFGIAFIVWLVVWIPNLGSFIFDPKVIGPVFMGVPLLVFWLRYFPYITGGDFNKIDWEQKGIVLRILERYVEKGKASSSDVHD